MDDISNISYPRHIARFFIEDCGEDKISQGDVGMRFGNLDGLALRRPKISHVPSAASSLNMVTLRKNHTSTPAFYPWRC